MWTKPEAPGCFHEQDSIPTPEPTRSFLFLPTSLCFCQRLLATPAKPHSNTLSLLSFVCLAVHIPESVIVSLPRPSSPHKALCAALLGHSPRGVSGTSVSVATKSGHGAVSFVYPMPICWVTQRAPPIKGHTQGEQFSVLSSNPW